MSSFVFCKHVISSDKTKLTSSFVVQKFLFSVSIGLYNVCQISKANSMKTKLGCNAVTSQLAERVGENDIYPNEGILEPPGSRFDPSSYIS
jgi:hypothetical protein